MKDCCFIHENNWFRYRAAALIVEDGKLLLIGNPSSPYLYTVGGGVHMGETAEACVTREAFEETGAHYEVDRLAVVCENFFTGSDGNIMGKDCQVLEFWFLMKPMGSLDLHSTSTVWNGSAEELHWIPLEELPNTNVKPSFLKESMPEILKTDRILHIVTEVDR